MAYKKYWKNTVQYRRILEILDDYWLTEPEEDLVRIDMHFEKGDETQDKHIIWRRPSQERTAEEPFNLVPSEIKTSLTPEEAVLDVVDRLFAYGHSAEEVAKALAKAQCRVIDLIDTHR